jgi:hypothetical protein
VWNKLTANGTYSFSNGKVRMEESYIGRLEQYLPSMEVIDLNSLNNITNRFEDVVKINMKILVSAFDSTGKEVLRTEDFYDKWYARNVGLIQAKHSSSGFATYINSYKIF